MDEFKTIRDSLQQRRDAHNQARLDLLSSAQRLRMLEQERAALERERSDNNESYLTRRRDLDLRLENERANRERNHHALKGASARLKETERTFALFSDPRQQLEAHFSNRTPFLLFPLRMETRFKTVGEQPQLWIRVYPDECLIDSFEPLLSKKEVNNAARFWAAYYSAGHATGPGNADPAVAELQKAAWQLLVSAHGDGRSAWITAQLRPEAASSVFPVRKPNSHILVIVTESWNPVHQSAIFDFFKEMWHAAGNGQLINQIKADFETNHPLLQAEQTISDYLPVNFTEQTPAGLKPQEADLQLAVVIFKDLDKKIGKEHAWSQPSKVNLLPERLALICFKNGVPQPPFFGETIPYPLLTSPDPSADAEKQFNQTTEGDLEFAEDIRWVADFDRAVHIGMGFRINLKPGEEEGFERIFVLGVRLGTDAPEGKKQLEELFEHHFYSKKGFSLVPQGTPTNNTEAADSGFTRKDNSDQTFEPYFKQTPLFSDTGEWTQKRDGQWIAEWLGLDTGIFKKILHSDGSDQRDARSMNIALWPATLGYVMESLMEGGFTADTIERTRDFFAGFVSGRGPVPAVRIGNQPYGILPTAAFRRLGWMRNEDHERFHALARPGTFDFLQKLYNLLLQIDSNWTVNMGGQVAHVTQPTAQPYQALLDIVRLHPNSVEFHRRFLESLIIVTNFVRTQQPGYQLHPEIVDHATQLLESFGYQTKILPQIAALLGMPWQNAVTHLIDDVPLSETKLIREYTADHKNYIGALIAQARTSEDALRTGAGLTERPDAELYRLLKYALELGYHDSALRIAETSRAFTEQKLASMRVEQPVVHQLWKGEVAESRYALLYQTVPQISGTQTVAEVVRDALVSRTAHAFARYLTAQVAALVNLEQATTAQLERAFVEHLDCCSYRLDAWKTGILHAQLSYMRANLPGSDVQQRQYGIYLGAFGWLENVKPEKNKSLSVKQIPSDLQQEFNKGNKKVFLADASNEGYIHAPSLNQAVTAAVLRNGYISHGKPDQNNVLAVNLSSERIRLALSVIEGIQGGQNLAALLGYKFERLLHDRNDLTSKGIDAYIYAIRKIFPFNAGQLKETKLENNPDPSIDKKNVPVTAIEARNVVNGRNLVNHVKSQSQPANKKYPFALGLPPAGADVADAITSAVDQIIDIADAVADLGVAESVHQVVMGNYDRAAGVLETYSKGNYPQQPDVIQTPRSGASVTHRVGIPLTYIAKAGAGSHPRSVAEPSINKWLSGILPGLNKIICVCTYADRTDNNLKKVEISLQDIGLQPIDVFYILNTPDTGAMTELDDRFVHYIHTKMHPRLDHPIILAYTERPASAAKISVFEIMPLIKSLRALFLESAVLTPADLALPNEAGKKDVPAPELPASRAQDVVDSLKDVLSQASSSAGIFRYLSLLPDPEVITEIQADAVLSKAGDTCARFIELLMKLGMYGIPQTGIGAIYDQQKRWFASLKNKVQEFIDRWKQKLIDYKQLAASAAPLPVETLQKMERLISITSTPAASINFPLVKGKHTAFHAEFLKLNNIILINQDAVNGLLQDIQAIHTEPFDLTALDVKQETGQIVLFIYDLKARAETLMQTLEKKTVAEAEKLLKEWGTLPPAEQVKQVEAAARTILGENFKMVPRYVLPASQHAELNNAWQAKDDLLHYLKTDRKYNNPEEDWLHGIARVHEKMWHLENCLLLRGAFNLAEDDLKIHPVQLPYKSSKYHWMALPFPEKEVNLEESNILLYTAFTAEGAPMPAEICGLLADEWAELIPGKKENTGIAFHYNRPNAEAPQAMLLVTPTQLSGNWQWADLVDALSYTLDAAKARGIEPGQIDKTAFSTLLPAVIGTESPHPNSIVLENKVHYLEKFLQATNKPID